MPGGKQLVVYDTAFAARSELAMVLPVPVRRGAGDHAVTFVDLSQFPGFFDRLDTYFVAPFGMEGGLGAAPGAYRQAPLVVHSVGLFEASYVPTRADFARLDPRFRLDDGVLDALGERSSYGFVVVKLARSAAVQRVHPIGFVFPSRSSKLFFPTVHVHDGRVQSMVSFDHALYTTDAARAEGFEAYGLREGDELPEREERFPGERWMDAGDGWRTAEFDHQVRGVEGTLVLAAGEKVYRHELGGVRGNDDSWVDVGPCPEAAEIVAAIGRAVVAGRPPRSLRQAVYLAHNTRTGFFEELRRFFGSDNLEDIEILRITDPGRGFESQSFFRVHWRAIHLRGRSAERKARSGLCALKPPGSHDHHPTIAVLHSRHAVDEWAAAGGKASPEELEWLRRAAS